MTHTLCFLPDVEEDVLAGYEWYEQKTRGLGAEFLRTLYAAAAEIARHPLHHIEAGRGFRRCLLRRFPYAVYFRVEGDRVIVFGVFHCARDPRNIGLSLRERGRQEGR